MKKAGGKVFIEKTALLHRNGNPKPAPQQQRAKPRQNQPASTTTFKWRAKPCTQPEATRPSQSRTAFTKCVNFHMGQWGRAGEGIQLFTGTKPGASKDQMSGLVAGQTPEGEPNCAWRCEPVALFQRPEFGR